MLSRNNKSIKGKIDDNDITIIENLIDDGRMSLIELAKKTGITRGMVAKRIKRMESEGIIEKFTVRISTDYFRKPLPVFFQISVIPNKISEVAKKLSKYEEIAIVYQMSGIKALHVHGYFNNIEDLHMFMDNKISPLSGIQNISMEFLIKKYKAEFL